jgi:DNA (cytosine-5)-methyltransferase 1
LNIISLFSGAGGLDLGFKAAGFNTIWANEYDQEIWDTFEHNLPDIDLDKRSIRDIPLDEIPDSIGIIGGPPCQSWSTAGNTKGIDDPRGKSFFEFIRVLRDKKPLFFVAENVPGILEPKHKEALTDIKSHFMDCGYDLYIKMLNANDYNVSQDRKRVFFIGFRKDLDVEYSFPGKLGVKPSLKDSIFDLKDTVLRAHETYYANNKCTVDNHEYITSDFSMTYMTSNRVRNWGEPSFTIPATAEFIPIHPQAPKMQFIEQTVRKFVSDKENVYRRLSVRECARIQSFPDNHKFIYTDIRAGYKMVGNAVPPNLAYSIAKSIYAHLNQKNL